jgi:hypothetical protein
MEKSVENAFGPNYQNPLFGLKKYHLSLTKKSFLGHLATWRVPKWPFPIATFFPDNFPTKTIFGHLASGKVSKVATIFPGSSLTKTKFCQRTPWSPKVPFQMATNFQ